MAIHKIAFAALALGLVTGCVETASTGGVSRDAITSVSTVAEFEALGATRLDEAAFRERVVDRTLIEADGSWIWTIQSDGTAPSEATDGSWSVPSVWAFRDGRYCRGEARPTGCSAVYAVGNFFRFDDGEGDDLTAGRSPIAERSPGGGVNPALPGCGTAG